MNNILYLTTNGIGILLILLMLTNFGSESMMSKSEDDRIFRTMLYVNLLLLLTDSAMQILDGKTSVTAGYMLRFTTALYFILQSVICLVWFLYCKYKLTGNMQKIIKQLPWIIIPAVLNAVMTGVSLFRPFYFYIDSQNHYERADYFYLSFVLALIYILIIYLFMLNVLIKDPKTLKRQTIRYLYLYPILPIICAVFQWLYYGLSVIWIGSVISLLIIYFNLQNTLITTDALTGLNNRRRFENYIENKLNAPIRHPFLFALMIDIDKFRNINNRYGHCVGDEALKNVADILKNSVSRNDFIARIGGEEFIVIGEREKAEHAFETMKTIKEQTALFNDKKVAPYLLSMSIGYAFIKNGEHRTADEIIREADKRMYNEKERVDGEL